MPTDVRVAATERSEVDGEYPSTSKTRWLPPVGIKAGNLDWVAWLREAQPYIKQWVAPPSESATALRSSASLRSTRSLGVESTE
jgi:hypothetical protein